MRQIVLDTETTGLEPSQGHRIIEIGCVELINRKLTGRHYHQYIQPQREVDAGAMAVHGITNEFLLDKPVFAQVAAEFLEFVRGAQLVIHNAPFDVGFINHEFQLLGSAQFQPLDSYCEVIDTLVMARQKRPGQKNNLDALCKHYGVDNSQRDLHGALLDAEILADVYLFMTGGQTNLLLQGDTGDEEKADTQSGGAIRRLTPGQFVTPVIRASEEEFAAHETKLNGLDRSAGGTCLWRQQ